MKPYSNSVKSRRLGGSGDLGSSVGLGANMETMRYQNEAALPNQHENDAQLFADIGKQFSAPGNRPRGAWRNLGAGIAKGLEYGAKSHAIGERNEKYDKYDRVMNYFQEVNNAAIEQNQWYAKREAAKKELMPQVLAYMDNIDRLDPQSQRIMAQDMLAQYGDAIGENFKLSSIDGSNPFLVTIQSDKGQQLFDLRSMFAGDEAVRQSIAMKMPEYQMRLQEERANKERDFQLKERALEMRYPSKNPVPEEEGDQSFDINGQNYSVISMNGMEKSAKADYQKTVNKSISQIPINNRAIESIQAMREIFDKNPNIGSALINIADSDDENSWSSWLGKQTMSSADRADMEILKKLSGDLNLSTVLSVPGKSATDLLKQTIKSSAPHGKLTKQAFDKIADSWEKRASENISLALAQAQGLQQGRMVIPNGYSNPPSHQNNRQVPDSGNFDLSDLGAITQ